jgi:hypothetical protein
MSGLGGLYTFTDIQGGSVAPVPAGATPLAAPGSSPQIKQVLVVARLANTLPVLVGPGVPIIELGPGDGIVIPIDTVEKVFVVDPAASGVQAIDFLTDL